MPVSHSAVVVTARYAELKVEGVERAALVVVVVDGVEIECASKVEEIANSREPAPHRRRSRNPPCFCETAVSEHHIVK